jgi:hypothetical protein
MVLIIGLLLFFCVSSCTVVFSASVGLAMWYYSGKDTETTDKKKPGANDTPTPNTPTQTQPPNPSQTPPPAAGEITYKLYSKAYSPGGDLVKIDSSNLETLRKECNDRGDKCVAFTSDGWLKGSLAPNFSAPYIDLDNPNLLSNSNLPGVYVKRVSTAADKSSLTWKTRNAVTDASRNLVFSIPIGGAVCRIKLTNGDDFVGIGAEVVIDSTNNALVNGFVYVEGTPQVFTTVTDTSKYECLVYDQGDSKNVKRPYWSSDPSIPATKRYKCGTMKDNGQEKAIYACRGIYTHATTPDISMLVPGYWKEGGDACVVMMMVDDANITTVSNLKGPGTEFLVYD